MFVVAPVAPGTQTVVAVDTLVLLLVVVLLVPSLLFGLAAGYATARLFGLPSQLRIYGDTLGVGRWSALLPTVLALSLLGAVEFAADVPTDGAPGSLPATVAMGAILVGALCLAVGLGNLRPYLRVRTVTAAVDLTEGRATVTGSAAAGGDGTVAAPLSGEPCLAWAVRIREYRGFGRRGIRGLRHSDHGGVPLQVRDGTGAVRVDPDAVRLTGWSLPPRSGDFDAEARDGLPDRVAAYRDEHDLGDGDRRVYEELRLTPGTEVTAIGRLESRDGRATLGGAGSLHRTPANSLRASRERRVLAGVVGAVVMSVGTIGLALVTGLV